MEVCVSECVTCSSVLHVGREKFDGKWGNASEVMSLKSLMVSHIFIFIF